jgi:hypothetical protein
MHFNELFDTLLNDDLKEQIYSLIIYKQPQELLIQIKEYQNKKKYINLFYKYITNYWTYCYIDGLNLIWKLYYICIICKADILWKDMEYLNICLYKFKQYISDEDYFIYTAEIIRILNIKNFKQKHLALKKYITKYVMVLKDHHIKYLNEELSIWGDITEYGYTDDSLSDFSEESILNSYKIPSPIILKEYIT